MSFIAPLSPFTPSLGYKVSIHLSCLWFLLAPFAFAEDAPQGPPPAQVTITEVKAVDAPIHIELPSVLMGSKEVEIRSRVPGHILTQNFVEGQIVQAGDSLFSLDIGPLQASVNRLNADLLALKAREQQAIRDLKRVSALKSNRVIAQKDVDDAISAKAVASADITAGEARLREAELNLDYAKVKSPITGVTSRALVSVGDYVQGPEDILVNVTQIDPIYARFSLPNRAMSAIMAQVASGDVILPAQSEWKTFLKFPQGHLYPLNGHVDFIDARVNTFTGSQEGRAIFQNPQGVLSPGQFLRIRIIGAYRPQVMTVPQTAVLDNAQGKFVYLYTAQGKGFVAQPQPVEVGEWVVVDQQNHWVIRSGLKSMDQVIDSGHARIFAPMSPVVAQPQSPDHQASSDRPDRSI